MTSRRHQKRKGNRLERNNHHNRRNRRVLSVRSAFVLQLASMAGLGTAFLLYLAHDRVPLIVAGAIGAFLTAVQVFDQLIE